MAKIVNLGKYHLSLQTETTLEVHTSKHVRRAYKENLIASPLKFPLAFPETPGI